MVIHFNELCHIVFKVRSCISTFQCQITILANVHVRMLGEDLKKHVKTKKDMVKTRV